MMVVMEPLVMVVAVEVALVLLVPMGQEPTEATAVQD